MQDNIWVERSRASLDEKYKGVLYSGFPDCLNDYLHQWTSQLITDHITLEDEHILDLGCGYGRVSLSIKEKFPFAFLVGLDISPYYAREYIQNIDHSLSVISDSVRLPFKQMFFDTIFEVFSLMYLRDKEVYRQAIGEMCYSLKDNGSILIIENNRVGTYFLSGFGILTLVSRIISKDRLKRTQGLLFRYKEIDEMIRQAGGVILKKMGMPIFTVFIPFNVLLGFISPKWLRRFLSVIRFLDKKLQILNGFSLYQFYFVKKCKKGMQKTLDI